MNPSKPIMLPLAPREDSPSVRAAQEQNRRGKDIMEMFDAGDRDIPSHAQWNVPTEDARSAAYQEWAATVPSVMGEKVISAQAVADILPSIIPGLGDDPLTLDEVKESIGGDYASMNDLIETVARTSAAMQGADTDAPEFDEFVNERINSVRRAVATGYGSEGDIQLAAIARDAVAQHAPNGQYAMYAGRTPEQAAEADAKYGRYADYQLTPEGQQNHRALRVAEFLSAADRDYSPATWDAQASRAVGFALPAAARGVQQLAYGDARPWVAQGDMDTAGAGNALFDPLNEFATISQPGGKYAHAMDMYRRSAFPQEGGEYSVYTSNDRPKYNAYSMMTLPGKAAAYMSASYPLGYGGNYLRNNAQPGQFIGNAMERGLGQAVDDNAAATRIRIHQNRITPRDLPGLTSEQSAKAGRLMLEHDGKADAFNSALAGPLLSDAMGTKERTYLSPGASGLVDVPGALVSDQTNLTMNAAFPAGGAVMSAIKAGAGAKTLIPALKQSALAGARSYGAGLAARVGAFGDDVVEEGVIENSMFGLPQGGFFEGQKTNALMDDMDPKDVTVQKVVDKYADAVAKRQEATAPVIKQMRKERPPAKDEPRSRYGYASRQH